MSKNIDEFISIQKERIEILVGSFDSLFETSVSVIKKDSTVTLVININGRIKHSQVIKAEQII